MNINKEQLDELNLVLSVELSPEDYTEKVEKSLKNYTKKVSLPGFRPGKVPASMVKKMHGKAILAEEINNLLNDTINGYIEENKIEILGNPLPKEELIENFEWDFDKNFKFSYEIGLKPNIDLSIDKNISLDYHKIVFDAEAVQKHIDTLRKQYGKVEPSEGSIEEDDTISVTFVELENGAEKENGIVKDATVLVKRIKEDTKKEVFKMKKGDSITLDPADVTSNETDLAAMLGISKDDISNISKTFRFTLNHINKLVLADENEEFFEKILGEGVKTKEEFAAKIKEQLELIHKKDTDNYFFNRAVEHLLDNVKFELPDDFLKRWIKAANDKPLTMEQISEEYDSYRKGLKWQLMETKIATDNDLKVTPEELREFTKNLIRHQYLQYGINNFPEEQLEMIADKTLKNQEELRQIYDRAMTEKILFLFKEKINLNNVEVSFDKFVELVKEQNNQKN
jgi:trigger factor